MQTPSSCKMTDSKTSIPATLTKAKTHARLSLGFVGVCVVSSKFVMQGLWSQVWNLTMLMLWMHSGSND